MKHAVGYRKTRSAATKVFLKAVKPHFTSLKRKEIDEEHYRLLIQQEQKVFFGAMKAFIHQYKLLVAAASQSPPYKEVPPRPPHGREGWWEYLQEHQKDPSPTVSFEQWKKMTKIVKNSILGGTND